MTVQLNLSFLDEKETTVDVIHGDCKDKLKELIEKGIKVDSIVTDPPYELGFMGKSWDSTGVAYDQEMWKLCLSALKPGGHLLAFGGSRTYHRMACAIEDAGFEIRDQIMYIYGQGFPKSLNIKKSATKQGICCFCEENPLPYTHEKGTQQTTKCNLRSMRETNISPPEPINQKQEETMFASLQEQVLSFEGFASVAEHEDGEKSCVERRDNILQEKGELYGSSLCAVSGRISSNGQEGWLHNGASIDNSEEMQQTSCASGSSEPHRPETLEQPPIQSRIMANKCRPQEGGSWPICRICSKPIIPEGLGSALKPAHEPICMARKPLEKGLNIAQNVLEHGAGGINVDGCRVGFQENETFCGYKDPFNHVCAGEKNIMGTPSQHIETVYKLAGRFPANLIHDGSDEVEAEFAKYGENRGGKWGKQGENPIKNMFFGEKNGKELKQSEAFIGDKGTASRFFYSAKASKKDRCGSKHPTVKPISLMRYLCRLITPPDGTVLDPFAGTGTTGQAAQEEGFNAILIEREPEYFEDIKRRVSGKK